jgi:hypothetical protein
MPPGSVVPQSPQSFVQLEHVSLPLHVPSPQLGTGGQAPQSAGHEVQLSPPLQVPLPHLLPPFAPNVSLESRSEDPGSLEQEGIASSQAIASPMIPLGTRL